MRLLMGILVGAMFFATSAAAEDVSKTPQLRVSAILPGCQGASAFTAFESGVCYGVIIGIMISSPDVCLPAEVTVRQVADTIVDTVGIHPSFEQANFPKVAQDVLEENWPCKH